jgi:uncharacterized membrane-anchored protein YitT (DUF2179 family)
MSLPGGKIGCKNVVLAVTGATVLAFGMCNVHAVSGITEGGTLGATLLLQHHFGISPAISAFVLNMLCYAVGIKTLGRRFLIMSAVSAVSYSVSYAVFEIFAPIIPEISAYPIICAFTGAIFVGVGVGLCVRAGGAPSGDDALAMSFSAIIKVNIKYVYLFTDLTVLALSLTYIPFTRIVYSLLTVILSGQIIGFISTLGKKSK